MKAFSYKVGGRSAGRIFAKDIHAASQKLNEMVPPNSHIILRELKNQVQALKEHYTGLLSKDKGVQKRGLWVFVDKEVDHISFYSYLEKQGIVAEYQYDESKPIWTVAYFTKKWLDEACEKIV